ncbi:MAG: tRNA preQ1(34) S-adenosylmethionine ribosyltransferase-isomerase QueA, partial [Magnetovibrio sp.]|nr:tRNA preQ1(34) S-adenosylmethionine ribosyltransferase-isomerase QueA [Magnetovibrio sp.]
MLVDLFDFELPQRNIAQSPACPRDSAKMLVVGKEALVDNCMARLADVLRPGDICVFNDTRVIPARLTGKRGEAGMEVTLHKQQAPDTWLAFARPAKKLKVDDLIEFADGFAATVIAKGDGGEVTLNFNASGDDLMAALNAQGSMPLPPYIKRAKGGQVEDVDDYQTLFAKNLGAVAAPTAGLHFTKALVHNLEQRGIKTVKVTLHVGAGTFLPVKVEDTADHKMHAERGEISAAAAQAINAARAAGGRVVAVGTTSLRVLESAADDDGTLHEFFADTSIFITPGYRFKIVDVMVTNFHLPRSTLFMLVAAFAGLKRMHAAYTYAIQSGYRFYS